MLVFFQGYSLDPDEPSYFNCVMNQCKNKWKSRNPPCCKLCLCPPHRKQHDDLVLSEGVCPLENSDVSHRLHAAFESEKIRKAKIAGKKTKRTPKHPRN